MIQANFDGYNNYFYYLLDTGVLNRLKVDIVYDDQGKIESITVEDVVGDVIEILSDVIAFDIRDNYLVTS